MIRKKLLFLLTVFCATVLVMAAQKPVFFCWYVAQSAGVSAWDLWPVLGHGLLLDMTVAGYVTVLPLLLVFLSLWIGASERFWRWVMMSYFVLISLFTALIFAVDLELYAHWGFRLNGTVLIYLADPKEALASVDFWMTVRQSVVFVVYAALMIWLYSRVVWLFDHRPVRNWTALPAALALLLLAGVDFVAIRGGLGTSVANISKVYFSSEMFLNHAATNPVFSFLSTLGTDTDYAKIYPFFSEQERAGRFEQLRGNNPAAGPTQKVLNTDRPNVVVVILESFSRSFMDMTVDNQAVMPNLQRFKEEGVWFENFFASSFRTDRGEVAVLSGFPAQTNLSIMKLPEKSHNLPSIARSLGRAGYTTSFTYGGDLNFTNQASYMYATGWQTLTWQKDLKFDRKAADWGYDDELMCNYFADQVIALDAAGRPFLAGLLTLSSHQPFDVPFHKFDDKVVNAMAFTDDCLGQMVERLKASPAWKNLLIVFVADHGYPFGDMGNYTVDRHRIPMIWLGGAVESPRVVDTYASQIDICASVLAQMDLAHDDFDYSKDILAAGPPRKFAYYVFEDGFGVVDASGHVIWNLTLDRALSGDDPQLLDIGRTMLQTTYTDIANR